MAFIETERTIVRTWMGSDAPAWYRIVSKPGVGKYIPASVVASSVESARAWIDRQMTMQERDGVSIWPIVRKSDGALIGSCGLFVSTGGGFEIGWVFDPDVAGQGYATETAQAVIAYARGSLHCTRIVAHIDRANLASVGVANRVGMRFDRIVRPTGRYEVMRYLA